jgi:hypothetical protein
MALCYILNIYIIVEKKEKRLLFSFVLTLLFLSFLLIYSTDNIMAGNYANLPGAVQGLYANQGIAGFYAGWFPGLAGKIPSYVS